MSLKPFLEKLNKGKLNKQEAFMMQGVILDGNFDTQGLVYVFEILNIRNGVPTGLYEEEMQGIFEASIKRSVSFKKLDFETIDIVGTGGDGFNTLNISTIAALESSKQGLKVTKHGNRSSSSKCGSADFLEVLGYYIEATPDKAYENLIDTSFTFLYAKTYHPAFRFAAPARKEFGKRTYFNYLGPLLNPARPNFMLLGIGGDFNAHKVMGPVLINSGVKKVWFIQSAEGLDELSPTSKN